MVCHSIGKLSLPKPMMAQSAKIYMHFAEDKELTAHTKEEK